MKENKNLDSISINNKRNNKENIREKVDLFINNLPQPIKILLQFIITFLGLKGLIIFFIGVIGQ